MSEKMRIPKRLSLQGICKIPAGKAGKAAAKQYANERKARKRALARLAEADSQSGVGLLVMLNSADRRLGRYIFKKLDKVIPFYVKALSDGTSGMPEEEMSWLMEECARRGYRTLWLDLTGTDKIDKRAVLHLVAGELVRVLEEPAPERASEVALAEAEVEPEAAEVEELTEPEAAEGEPEAAEVEELTEPEMAEATEMPEPEAAVDEPVEPEAVAEEETAASDMGTEIETVAEAIGELQEETIDDDKKCASEKFLTEAVSESEDIFAEKEPQDIDAVNAEDVIVDPKAEAIPVVEEKPAPGKRTKKTSTKAEGEKAPAKPRRKRAPAAPLTVEATLAKRRRQMGLE